MNKDTRNAKRITKDEYLSLFPDDKMSNSERKRFQALKEAQKVRQFEIELYWKRTGFFWAFITIIYTAFFHVLCKYIECSNKYALFVPCISALAGLGFFFSVAWHLVNKGSKFWQKNWEKHVSLLEKPEIGPLYDVYLNPKGTLRERWYPTEAFDFSVTKVNMWASAIMIVASLSGAIGIDIWLIREQHQAWYFVLIPSILILLFCMCLVLRSDGNKDVKLTESKQAELNMIQIL